MRAGLLFSFLLLILAAGQLSATAKQYVCHSPLCPRLEFASDLVLTHEDNGTWKAKLTLNDDKEEVFRTVGNYDGHETLSSGSSVVDFRWQTGVTSHDGHSMPWELRVRNPERTFQNYKQIILEIKNSYQYSRSNLCTYQCDGD